MEHKVTIRIVREDSKEFLLLYENLTQTSEKLWKEKLCNAITLIAGAVIAIAVIVNLTEEVGLVAAIFIGIIVFIF